MNARMVGMMGLVWMMSWVPLVGMAAADESYWLVKVSDMDRIVASQVMSSSNFKSLEKEIQAEKKHFPAAVQLAAKAWKEDQSNKNVAFPVGRIVPRALVGAPERFATQAKADEQLAKYQERESQKETREKDKTKGKVAKSKEEVDRERKKAGETSKAIDLIKAKIADLIAGKSSEPAPAAGAGEKVDPLKPAKK